VAASVFLAAIVSLWSLLCLPFVIAAGVILIRFYIRSFREMTRIETVTNSPILSNFGETLSGTTTIRCFGKQKDFVNKNHKLVDDNLNAFFWSNSLNLWFSIRLQYISSFMISISLAFCIACKYSSDINTIGTLMITLLGLQANILWFFRLSSEVEGGMVSYDRCDKMLQIPQEKFGTHSHPGESWPKDGIIKFDNICLRYRPETELVLRNLSFDIDSKQKVGVVGRTGAGKSTVCLALCRIIECESGKIIIDGIDISQVDLSFLRSMITIIPQDPILFEGSLRFNLDPENKCQESDIQRIVSKANLQELWDEDKEIAQNGENLSSGEKQLICICRAILRKTKIILMDEATSNIDIKTEEIIQKLITDEFKESTVITIAHRLNTIMNSDKVLILEQGQLVHREIDDFREYFA
jgi:ATP-binding cassette, subfamily C (CFTR/MRP), member 1